MSDNVRIWFDPSGMQDLLTNNSNLDALSRQMMEERAATARNQFVQDFGFTGTFNVEATVTSPSSKYGTTRMSYRLSAGDARTTAALKKQPGWLNQFIS